MTKNIFDFKRNGIAPQKGEILVAAPLLQGKHFNQSIILITEHNEEGSMGFVLNKPLSISINEMLNSFNQLKNTVFLGGPVNTDYLFYIHKLEIVPESLPLGNGLFWGGNLTSIINLLNENSSYQEQIKFFSGYSGWSSKQLQKEIELKSWLVSHLDTHSIMNTPSENLWTLGVQSLGKPYEYWLNFPSNPMYN